MRDRDIVILRLPRPRSPWRKIPIRGLRTFIGALESDRALYWRLLGGHRNWAVVLIHRGRKGDAPPRDYSADPIRLNPKWGARKEAGPDASQH